MAHGNSNQHPRHRRESRQRQPPAQSRIEAEFVGAGQQLGERADARQKRHRQQDAHDGFTGDQPGCQQHALLFDLRA